MPSRRDEHHESARRLDVVLPGVFALATFVPLYLAAWARARALEGSFDLGYFRQAAWLITSGRRPFVTVRGLHLLGDHFSPIFYPIAAITAVGSDIPALLAFQSAALALGVVPLWLLCRRVAGVGPIPATGACVAYALFPALHNVNLFDFHPEVVAVPALLGAVLFALSDRWWPYAACVGVVLLCREDHALVVVGLGLLVALEGRRRAGLLTSAAGLIWLAVITTVVQPALADGYVGAGVLDAYGSDVGEIAATMLGDPGRVLADFWQSDNLTLVLALLLPVAFLPLLAPRFLLPAVPLVGLHMLSNRPAAHTINAHYSVVAIAFVFAALAMALGRLPGNAPVLAVPLLVVAGLVGHHELARDSFRYEPWDWRRDRVDEARLDADAVVPHDAAVAASMRMWPLLADREALFFFPAPWERYEPQQDPVPLGDRRAEVDWIVVDTADRAQWPLVLEEPLDRIVEREGFALVFDRRGIEVYERRPPPGRPPGRGA